MKYFYILLVCLFLQGCDKYYYYYYFEDGEKLTNAVLHSDDKIGVYFSVYNGNISRLNFLIPKDAGKHTIEVLQYEHYFAVNGSTYKPYLVGGNDLGIVIFPENGSFTITSKFVFEQQPDSIFEAFEIKLLIEDELIIISREFDLVRDYYRRFEASH
ncbi:hypothetical protein [Reinekea sp.]|uniref:hypothetical protein n=1 Tax=Reinekea sp. TaxID=1970455 RepID=UPI002A82D234|nr:hypothetical protein [Reinekea sp.]